MKRKEQKGITLVALVITVIVTLILAGVGISLITGENGLFTKANHAASEYNSKAQSEATKFSELMNYLNGNYGSGDGASQGGGAQTVTYTVAYDANNGTGAPSNDTKIQGTDLTLSAIVPTRSGYKFLGWSEDQNATTATYQAGGTYNTEASTTMYAVWRQQIADNMTLAQAKGLAAPDTKVTIKAPLNNEGTVNQNVVIPAGFNLASDTGNFVNAGIVIKDESNNQFVWIPVENAGTGYARSTFSRIYNGNTQNQIINGKHESSNSDKIYNSENSTEYFYEALDSNEYNSVNTNKGYYIGRYEASGSGNTVKVQDNQSPWVSITQADCVTKSAILGNGYRTAYPTANATVFTKLCSSYAWDTALRFIDANSINSSYSSNSTQDWYGQSAVQNTGLTTAVCNIYDMGGNVNEYTTESYSYIVSGCAYRGGNYGGSASGTPAGYRNNDSGNGTAGIGFRVTLFV